MKSYRSIVGIIIMTSLCLAAHAQEGCEQQLNVATEEFNAGRFYGIPNLLKPCIDNGFSKEQRQRAYLLLTQVYLLLDDPIAAEDSYLKVLRANPEYHTNVETDPIDVVYLSKKFTADPIFSVYGRVGGNTSIVRVIHNVYPSSGERPINTKYTLRPGWQIAAGLDWHFHNRLTLSGELNFSFNAYKKDQSFRFERDDLELIERQTWLSVPILLKYSDNAGSFRPYGFLGYSVNLLTGDRADIQIQNRDVDETGDITKPAQSPTLNFKDQRTALNFSFLAGGGVKYKWKLDYLFAEVRYAFGMKNMVDVENIFASEAMQRYGHADDYFRLDNLALSFGYIRPLYKPRKLKRAKNKGLLRFINKKNNEEND
jgi:opacity protein-like surface antigen